MPTDTVSLKMNGPGGLLTYRSSGRVAKLSVEISGNPEYDILLHLDDLGEWAEPRGTTITREDEDTILRAILTWEQKQKAKTDLPGWARDRLK